MGAFAWSIATASLAFFSASPSLAQRASIDVPAGPLGESVRQLSDQTGASIGFSGRMPSLRTRRVRGASSPAEALRQMLEGTGLRAVATGPASFRIEPVPTGAAKIVASSEVPRSSERLQRDIIVTAFKRPQPLSSLPATDHIVQGDSLRSATGFPGASTLSREVPSLTVTGLGPGRDRLFLRGIGDGPLNGFAQGSVATFLDDARLNYDAPDPDWALVDIDKVEIVEGPQGPLYGTGALGGILRISTSTPDLHDLSGRVSLGSAVTQDSGLSDSESLALNLPVVPDTLATRIVGYRSSSAGWIDNAGGRGDSNRERLTGGRIALRWSPAAEWTLDAVGAVQNRKTGDSQYVDGELGPLVRPNRLREPRDIDTKFGMISLKGPVGGLELTSITSLSTQEIVADYDATPLASILGTSGVTLVRDDRSYRVFDEEVRLRNSGTMPVSWVTGLSFVKSSTAADVVAGDSAGAVPMLTLKRSISEAAIFGEASAPIAPKLTLGVGARIFSSSIGDEGRQGEEIVSLGRHTIRSAGDLSLTWNPRSEITAYMRAATGYRPGGANPKGDGGPSSYLADELATVEVGVRTQLSAFFSLDADAYASSWRHVQADELLANGLVATRNAGNARNVGVEAEFRWSLPSHFSVSGAVMVQSARLDAASQAAVEDARLPAVPEAAGRLVVRRGFRIGGWDGNLSLGMRFVGATHMSFDPVLDRRTGSYALLDGSVALSRDRWTLSLIGENLTNSRIDTFAFGNPFRVRAEPQRTPARPLTIGISVNRSF